MERFREIYFQIYCNASQGHFEVINEDKTIIIAGISNTKIDLMKVFILVSRSSSSKRTKGKWKKK